MPKHDPGQLSLDGRSRSQGVIERACGTDLAYMSREGLLPAATSALQSAYRTIGREIDRAKREGDRWGLVAASRELRSLREQLGIVRPTATRDELREALAELSATPVRH